MKISCGFKLSLVWLFSSSSRIPLCIIDLWHHISNQQSWTSVRRKCLHYVSQWLNTLSRRSTRSLVSVRCANEYCMTSCLLRSLAFSHFTVFTIIHDLSRKCHTLSDCIANKNPPAMYSVSVNLHKMCHTMDLLLSFMNAIILTVRRRKENRRRKNGLLSEQCKQRCRIG